MEWRKKALDLSDGTTTITNVPCLVKGLFVNKTLSAHDLSINDGTSAAFVIPASEPSGSVYDYDGTRFDTKPILVPHASATGEVTILYKVLR